MSNLAVISAPMQNDRCFFGAGRNGSVATGWLSGFNGQVMTADLGWVMPYNGSVVAMGGTFNVGAIAIGTEGNVEFSVTQNGPPLIDQAVRVLTGGNKSFTSRYRKGLYRFNEGDIMGIYFDRVSVNATFQRFQVCCFVEFDR